MTTLPNQTSITDIKLTATAVKSPKDYTLDEHTELMRLIKLARVEVIEKRTDISFMYLGTKFTVPINPLRSKSSPVNMLTKEKIEQETKTLANEDLTKFPSLFQQARNLAKQAWLSGKGVAEGRGFLTPADTALARLDICSTCEFYKESRCLKCGCFMDKKVHLEAASCPINKWEKLLPKI